MYESPDQMPVELPVFEARTDPRPLDPPWPTMTWPVPEGTRLVGQTVTLTPVDPAADGPSLFGALDDDRVWAHLAGRPVSAPASVERLRVMQAAGYHPWLVRLSAPLGELPTGAVVGTTSYLEVAPADARLEIGSTAYAPAVWASRVNPEAKLLLLTLAFDTLGAGRVQLKTDIRNVRSQQAIARLGATYEGVLRRYQRRSDGSVRDTVLFSITAEQWPEVRARLIARLAG